MKDISLSMIFRVVLRRLWIIALAAIIVGAGTFLYCSKFVSPTYSASSSVIVTNGGLIKDDNTSVTSSGKISNTDVAASINIIETCVDILKTHSFYEEVAKEPNVKILGYSATDLRRMTNIEKRSDYSLFIDIKVACGNDKDVVTIANAIAETAPKYIPKIISNTRVETEPSPQVPSLVAPLSMRTAVVAALLAAVLVVAVFVILAATDNTIKGEEDIIKKYNVAVLGVVPDFEPKNTKGAKQ